MTVLQRLHRLWALGRPDRDDRAYQYAAYRGREELVAELMVDALDQATGRGDRPALMQFVKGRAPKLTHSSCAGLRHLLIGGRGCGEVLQLFS